ncbi:MAG: hypothetical protein ACE5E1_06490 [Phycisphaerae bacterium]
MNTPGLKARILAVMGLVGGGCAGPRISPPSVDPATLGDEGFQAYLAEAELVTVDEAYRAMLILADGEDTAEGFAQRREVLESRGIAKRAWDLRPDHVIDAGSVAYMVCRICRIGGGVNMRLFGRLGLGDRRYALRELAYRKMVDEAVDYQYMTGPALFALMRKADALMEKKGLYEPTGIDLSDETDRDERGELIVPPPARLGPEAGS